MSGFRIAVIQPRTTPPPEDAKNVDGAVEWIARAAREGADFVCFPETYPGPWRMPAQFDPSTRIAEAAAAHKVHVVYGTIEPIDVEKRTAYNVICMAYPDGRTPVRYRRTHPNGPWIYTGRTGAGVWDFEWVPGNEFPVFDTVHGTVGLAMCSEVFMPEVARALALRGAELIFMPIGGGLNETDNMRDTWRTLLWARAIENLALVVTTKNMLDDKARGRAMIASPEAILYESASVGMCVVEVSLDRVRELRAGRDGNAKSRSSGAKQGILSEQWQRPELYDHFYPRPLAQAAE